MTVHESERTNALAARLLEAQVAWAMDELRGDRLLEIVDEVVGDALTAGTVIRLDAVATPDEVSAVLRVLLDTVPQSELAGELARVIADQVRSGPKAALVPGDLVDRDRIAAVVDAAMPLRPLVERGLDRLAASPLVGTLASRFVTRLVVEVLEANRSATRRIPGLGSIVSMGTNAATRVVDVADRQVQSLMGDTAGKGAAIAVRRLNAVLLATMADDSFRDAVLEVWDLQADTAIPGLADNVSKVDAHALANATHELVADVLASPLAQDFLDAWVGTFFDRYGEDSITSVLHGFGVGHDEIREVARTVVPRLMAGLRTWGALEEAIRRRLAPFYDSPRFRAAVD